jgi:hypothetical protein
MCVIVHSSLQTSYVGKQALQNDKKRTAINNELIIRGANADEVYLREAGNKFVRVI